MPTNRPRTARHRPLRLRRVVPSLVAAAVAVLLIPLPAVAVSYTVAMLEAALCPGGNTVKLPESVDEPAATLDVACTATLDLNGHELKVHNIIITSGSTFTITDTSAGAAGVVTANAPANEAGIRTTGATLIIARGTVNATGGNYGAGIGSRQSGGSGGTVIISGGTVHATAGSYGGAGIGGGETSDGAVVEITGGTVTATGGESGAGIGGGIDGDGGSLTVSGGTVTATGGFPGAAGIGGGARFGTRGDGGVVTIRGGTVTATGGAAGQATADAAQNFGGGAGIGGGGAFQLTSGTFTDAAGSGGTVVIEGGVVTATAGSARAATIGAGGDLSDPNLAGAPGTLTLGASAVRTDELPTPTTPRTIITFGVTSTLAPSTPSTPVLTGGALPALPAGGAAWNRTDGTRPRLPASASGARAVTYGTAPAGVTVTGAPGTTAARGVVADPNGELVAEVCMALPVGSVIEVWVLSTPRLVAAHRVTDAPCQRFAVPFATPLDAGGPVAAGTHTLQFALATAGGMESFDIGITVGGPVPNLIPAGEGPGPVWMLALLAFAGALLGGLVMRSTASNGPARSGTTRSD
jgi:hypothetical protein